MAYPTSDGRRTPGCSWVEDTCPCTSALESSVFGQEIETNLRDLNNRSAIVILRSHNEAISDGIFPNRQPGAGSAPDFKGLRIGPWMIGNPFDKVEDESGMLNFSGCLCLHRLAVSRRLDEL